MTWSPAQYERFKDERSRPFWDLLALVRRAPDMRVVDLGCGTGALTRAMHEALGAKETLGVDSSPEMLAGARERPVPGLSFERGDLGAFDPPVPFDLVFSNAAAHWVDDHRALFARLARAIAPGGQLAVQVPANHDHPSQTVAADVAREEPFASALGGWVRVSPVLAPEAYAVLLDGLGFAESIVRLQVYVHHLASRAEVVEWVKGTTLIDYERRMNQDLWMSFLDRYRERLLARLDDARPFVFPFKRIFLWGKKP